MLSKININTPFNSQRISMPLDKLKTLLSEPECFNRGDTDYFNEDILQKTKATDDETQVFIWLSRIIRYFSVKCQTNEPNTIKKETAPLILKFLKDLNQFNKNTTLFLCTNTTAINGLIITLLMSEDKNEWESFLTLFRSHQPENNPTYQLLDWYYRFIFNLNPTPCAELINTLDQSSPTPIFDVLLFIALSQSYIQDPEDRCSSFQKFTLPFTATSHELEILATILLKGDIACSFTQNTMVLDYQETLSQIFRAQFKVLEEGQVAIELPLLKNPQYKSFLWQFIATELHKISPEEQEEQQIGLSQMIRFHSLKPMDFKEKIRASGVELSSKLFAKGHYTEAYLLHDDLIQFTRQDQPTPARVALFCFCCRIEQWLSSKGISPSFKPREIEAITQLKNSYCNFQLDTAPTTQLLILAKRMAQFYAQSSNKTTQQECVKYYHYIKNYLGANDTEEMDKLFKKIHTTEPVPPKAKEPTKRNEKNQTKAKVTSPPQRLQPQSKKQSKPKALSVTSAPEAPKEVIAQPINILDATRTVKKVKSKKKIPANPPQNLSVSPEPVVEEIPKPIEANKSLAACTFFAEKPPALSIKREQFPQELLQLIDELRQKLPEGSFYLAGGAPGNLLHRIQPNDYDIITLNVSLNSIQAVLQSKMIYSTQRGLEHPILFCPLPSKINIDFSAMCTESQHYSIADLRTDFERRDFKNNALYLQFTDEPQFALFSFENALEQRNIIECVDDSPKNSFMKDPTRLFRLANLLIIYPELSLADNLKKDLLELKYQWFALFHHYFQQHKDNFSRLDQAIRKLFLRYSFEQINKAFSQLHVLTLFTGNSEATCAELIAKIPDEIHQELKYQAWIIVNGFPLIIEGKMRYVPLSFYLNRTLKEEQNFKTFQKALSGESIKDPFLLGLLEAFNLVNNSSQPGQNI